MKKRSHEPLSDSEQERLDSALWRPVAGKISTPIDLYTLPDFPSPRPLLAQLLRLWRETLHLSLQEWQTLKATPLETFATEDQPQPSRLHLAALVQRFASLHEAQQYARAQLDRQSSILHHRYVHGDCSGLSELIAVESPNQPWLVEDPWYKAAILRELRKILPRKKPHRPSKPGGKVKSNREAASRLRALTLWEKKIPSYLEVEKDPWKARKRLLADFEKSARIKDPDRKEITKQQLRQRFDNYLSSKS